MFLNLALLLFLVTNFKAPFGTIPSTFGTIPSTIGTAKLFEHYLLNQSVSFFLGIFGRSTSGVLVELENKHFTNAKQRP